MKYELENVAFNQDVITVNGSTLYEYKEWLTDGNMAINKNCVNIENCTIKPLEEKMYKNYIEPIIKQENLLNVIADENQIIYIYDRDYLGNNIYKTNTKYVVIGSSYHEIFQEEGFTITFYKDSKFYFFLPLCDTDGKENNHLMFVGMVMACQATKKNVQNAIAINEFYDKLEHPKRDLIATEYDIETFKPSGIITKPKGF